MNGLKYFILQFLKDDRDRLLGRSTSIGDPITATRMIHRQKEAEDATTMMIQVGNTGNES